MGYLGTIMHDRIRKTFPVNKNGRITAVIAVYQKITIAFADISCRSQGKFICPDAFSIRFYGGKKYVVCIVFYHIEKSFGVNDPTVKQTGFFFLANKMRNVILQDFKIIV